VLRLGLRWRGCFWRGNIGHFLDFVPFSSVIELTHKCFMFLFINSSFFLKLLKFPTFLLRR